ncbi:MAG: hypothetical protein KAQ68_06955 [Clostridiales bacterium]|nr:hypothetical protein [Clostridiales bacterium]
MDTKWERAITLYEITKDEIENIFSLWDKSIIINGFEAINLGCKNSNFKVNTQDDTFLLRITPNVSEYNNEINIYRKIAAKLNVPKLYYHCIYDGKHVLIYQYIKSISLQMFLENKDNNHTNVVTQVAKAAATIHNFGIEDTRD